MSKRVTLDSVVQSSATKERAELAVLSGQFGGPANVIDATTGRLSRRVPFVPPHQVASGAGYAAREGRAVLGLFETQVRFVVENQEGGRRT